MTKKIKLKKYGDSLWHPESRLVFKSRKEKLVVGRLDDKEELIVDDKMVELSEQWNFKLDPDIVESAEESDEPACSPGEPNATVSASGVRTPRAKVTKSGLEGGPKVSPTQEANAKLPGAETSWQAEMEKGSTLLRMLNRMYEIQVQENEKLEMELKKVKNERDAISNKMNAIKSLFS
jgi:hypothetical protein